MRRRTVSNTNKKGESYSLDVYDFRGIRRIEFTLSLMEHKKTGKRTVLFQTFGEDHNKEGGIWLNPYARKKQKSGSHYYMVTWAKPMEKRKGIQAAFDSQNYPDYFDGAIPDWIGLLMDDCDDRFGRNEYVVAPFGIDSIKVCKFNVPYIGLGLSLDYSNFLVRIGNVVVAGEWKAPSSDNGFGSGDSSNCDLVGWYSSSFYLS